MSYWSGCDAHAVAGVKTIWIGYIAALGSERSPGLARPIASTFIQIILTCEPQLLVRNHSLKATQQLLCESLINFWQDRKGEVHEEGHRLL